MISPDDVSSLAGAPVLDPAGDVIGTLHGVYLDPATRAPLWAAIETHVGGAPLAYAPMGSARRDLATGAIHVPQTKAQIEDAPLIHAGETLPLEQVQILRSYYQEDGDAAGTATDLPDNGTMMVLYEERAQISTRFVPVRRVRVKKVIVTEEKTFTVTLRHEELRITDEDFQASEHAITDHRSAPLELILHEERADVTVSVAPIERVHVGVDRVSSGAQITVTLRSELADLETVDAT